VKELEQECERLGSVLSIRTAPRDSALEVLASSVRIAAYGARARSAASDLERFARAALDVACEIPVGIDPLSWAAAFHLAGPRPGGPLIVAEGTALQAHTPEYWSDTNDGPLRRAEGGTLVILNLAALPIPAQEALAQALWQRSAPAVGARVPPVLFATLAASARELVEARRLSLTLAQYLMPRQLRVPPLRERKEDLRGLILDRLLRSGARGPTEALGIEPEAMALLLEYDWPANESELHGVIDRAARAASAERILVADLEQVGFAGIGRAGLVRAPVQRSEDSPASELERRSRSSGPPAPAISGVRRAMREADAEGARRPEERAADALSGTETAASETEPDLARTKRASPRRRRRR
jgi:DNA-binding NtrC family response regulator